MTHTNGAKPHVQNQHAYAAIEPLKLLIQKELPIAAAMKLRKMVKAVQDHLEIVQEARRDLILRCAVLDDDGQPQVDEAGQPVIAEDKRDAYNQELTELLLCAWEDAPRISVAELDGVKVKTATLLDLDAFLED